MSFLDEIEIEDLNPLLNGINIDKKILRDINRALDKVGIYYRSFARIKSPDSLVEKLKYKNEKYKKDDRRLQDIVGVRIVLYFEDDIDVCRKIIQEMYEVHQEDSQIDTLGTAEFKPERMNLVCSLPVKYVKYFQVKLWQNYRIDKTFELQIRTIFSEGWHEVEHDIRYKHENEWNAKGYYEFNRELNGIKATLEMCDNSIVHIIERITYYCYKNDKVEEMLRYKFRIHFDDEYLSEDLRKLIDLSLRKELYKIVREDVLMCLANKSLIDIPKSLDNLVYICNGLQIHNKEIEKMTPKIIKEYIEKYQNREKSNRKGV